MAVAKPVNIAMRALQFLWTLLVMAIVGNMIAGESGPSIINYQMFVAVISMLSLFYLIPATILDKFVIHPILPLVLDLMNVLWWFCGAVALAAKLGVHSCSSKKYLKNNSIVRDSGDRCHEAQAVCAFLFFGFFAYLVSAVLSGLGMGGGGVRTGGIRRGPAMSQV